MVMPVKETEIYTCKICEYVYDFSLGDPESGIDPCTHFDMLPEKWICPICSASKDEFEKESS